MHAFIRLLTAAVSLASITAVMPNAFSTGALAQAMQGPKQMAPQAAPPPAAAMKQMQLTEKQIQGVLAAEPDMDKITEKLPENAKPDSKILAQLDAVAKKNGFGSYDEYNVVVDNIGLVLAGFDPATKKYVGAEAVIKAQIAQIESNKKISPSEKKDALADLNQALKAPLPPIENQGNIDLVAKYFDKLAAALGDEEE
jgi:hypothetical protein